MFIPNLLSADSGGETTLRARIVVVEDEPDLRDAVAEYLIANGFDVTSVGDAASMRALAEHETFQLAILDIAMPGEDGLSLGRWLRSKMPIGIIFATAAGTSIDRVVGLEIGADDYLVKPYELRELLARVRSVLRRVPRRVGGRRAAAPPAETDAPRRRIFFGQYQADLDARMVTGPSGVLDMAKSEFDVLEVFLKRANRLLTRTAISEAIGLSEDPENSRAVDIRIMRLQEEDRGRSGQPEIPADGARRRLYLLAARRGDRRALTCPPGGQHGRTHGSSTVTQCRDDLPRQRTRAGGIEPERRCRADRAAAAPRRRLAAGDRRDPENARPLAGRPQSHPVPPARTSRPGPVAVGRGLLGRRNGGWNLPARRR